MRLNIHSFQIVRNSALGNNVVNISDVLINKCFIQSNEFS